MSQGVEAKRNPRRLQVWLDYQLPTLGHMAVTTDWTESLKLGAAGPSVQVSTAIVMPPTCSDRVTQSTMYVGT